MEAAADREGYPQALAPAAVLYAAAVVLAGSASAAYWWYASGRGSLLRPGVGRARVRALRARGLSAPVLFALTLPIAVFAPYARRNTVDLRIPPYPDRVRLVLR